MIDRSRRLEVDAGDVANLLALELVLSLAAYNRSPVAVILPTIAAADPTRDALLRDAQRARRAAAAVERRQAHRDRLRRVPAALTRTAAIENQSRAKRL